MAWFSNGRKYWKHQGRIYSCRVKHHFKKKSNDNKAIEYDEIEF